MADETILIKVEVEGQQAMAGLTTAIEKQETSIASLREENKRLNKERNAVNLNSEEGRKRLVSLNDQLDANNKKIKENVDAYTKQKIGVGDYSAALDKLVPGLGATATGFGTMTKQSLAFIATPIGAVIAALGIAIGALTAYFKGSEEGQDKLGRATAVLGVAFEKLMQIVEFVGKAIMAYVEFWAGAVKSFIDFVSPALGNLLDEAINTGVAIAKMEEELGDVEDALIVKRAETGKRVAELRSQAIAQEGAERRKTIQEAIDLEEQLAAKEVELAQKTLEHFLADQAQRGAITGEEKTRIAELEAAVINAEAQKFEATLRFTKELEKLNEEERKKQAIIDEEEEGRRLRAQEFDLQMFVQTEEVKRLEIEKTTSATLAAGLKVEQARVAGNLKSIADAQKTAATKKRIDELEAANKLATISSTLGQASALFEQDSVAYKFLGAMRATIDTYRAANLALASYPPPFGAIAAGVAIATGLANVAKITGVGFAEGGYTGDGGKHEVAGIVHRGEYVVPKHIVQNPMYSGYISSLEGARRRGYEDGGLVTNSATSQIEQQAMMSKAFQGMSFFVSWKEGYDMGQNVAFKERIATQ
jgi:hypothetical protein